MTATSKLSHTLRNPADLNNFCFTTIKVQFESRYLTMMSSAAPEAR